MIRSSFLYQFNDFIYFFGFFLVMLIKIALPCFFGQQLITESEKIMFTVYELPWYESNLKHAKALLILMTRVCVDIKFRIRGIYDLDFMHLRGVEN